jgi:hypothetical protein
MSPVCTFSLLVGPPGLEPGTKGFRFVQLSLLPGLCLHHSLRRRWVPSSLYTFKVIAHPDYEQQCWCSEIFCVRELSS